MADFVSHPLGRSLRKISICSQSCMNTGVGSIIRSLTLSSKRKCGIRRRRAPPDPRGPSFFFGRDDASFVFSGVPVFSRALTSETATCRRLNHEPASLSRLVHTQCTDVKMRAGRTHKGTEPGRLNQPGFDRYSRTYQELRKDPIPDPFIGRPFRSGSAISFGTISQPRSITSRTCVILTLAAGRASLFRYWVPYELE